jgi:hypothetical protein
MGREHVVRYERSLKTGRGRATTTTTLATFKGVTGRTKMASKVTRALTSTGRHLPVKHGDEGVREGREYQ